LDPESQLSHASVALFLFPFPFFFFLFFFSLNSPSHIVLLKSLASTALPAMDRGLSTGTHQEHDGLRERNVTSQTNPAATTEALTATGDAEPKGKTGKAFGRTPGGTGMSYSTF